MTDTADLLRLNDNTKKKGAKPIKNGQEGLSSNAKGGGEPFQGENVLKLNGTIKQAKRENDINLDLTDCNVIAINKDTDPNKKVRVDALGNEIKKHGKHKLTWVDKISKEKTSVVSVVKIENFKNYFANFNTIVPQNGPPETKKTEEEDKPPKCKCTIF